MKLKKDRPPTRSKAESIQRSQQKYQMKQALLKEWDELGDDPEYVAQLERDVRRYHNQLVNKGALLPNET